MNPECEGNNPLSVSTVTRVGGRASAMVVLAEHINDGR